MKRILLVLVLALALVTPASTALGDKPSRGCPPPFDPVNLRGFTQIINELFPDAAQEEIVDFFNRVDQNDDGTICNQRKVAEGHFNVVDNTANAEPPGQD